jgi:hypothetical protein
MKKIMSILLMFFLFNFMLSAQTNQDTLIGMVNKKKIHISRNDGGSTFYQNITNIPLSDNPYRLTWCEPNQCFYTVYKNATNGGYFLCKIAPDGVYTILGNISIPGDNIDMIEALSFNRFDNELYASVSMNGASPADYWSERLLRIDIPTLTGTLVGTFNHASPYEPEADVFAFDDNGMLYYMDGQPGGSGFVKIFRQDILFALPAELIYSSSYFAGSDFTIKDNVLYFATGTTLKQIDLSTDVLSTVGSMFTSTSYNGESIRGLTWRTEFCAPLDIIPSDTIYCSGDTVVIDSNIGIDWSYLWSTGEGSSVLTITDPGMYSVIVNNTSGTCIHFDTINVIEQLLPVISAGVDDTICLGDNIQLIASGIGVLGNYLWSNGIIDSLIFEPLLSSDYIVQGTDSIGCFNLDTVHVEVLAPGNPAFSYGITSLCYSDADVVPVIVQYGGGFSSTPLGLNLDTLTGIVSPQNSLVGNYTLTYTIDGDCAIDSIMPLSIVSGPVLNSINDRVYCEGELFLDLVFSPNTNLTINWTNDNVSFGMQISGIGTISNFNIEDVSSYQTSTVIYTPSLGTCEGDSDTLLITVNNSPIVNAGMNDTICLGDAIQLNASGAGINGTYAWNSGVANSVNFEPLLTTDYIVQGTDSIGCVNSDTVHIEVLFPENPVFSYGANSFCYSEEEGIALAIQSGGVFSFSPVGLDLDTLTGIIAPQNSLVGDYAIVYTLDGDCPVDSVISISIVNGPSINQISDIEYCEGELFLDVDFNTSSNVIINWENDNSSYGLQPSGVGVVSSFTIEEVNSNQVSTIIYVLSIGTCVGEADTFNVLIKNKPDLIIDDYQTCYGDSVLILINNIDNAILTVLPNILNYEYTTVISDQTYNLTADLNGCISNYQFDIYLTNSPDANFTANEEAASVNEFIYSFNLNNQTQNIQNYNWSFGDGLYSNDAIPIHDFEIESGQTFEISLTVQNEFGCEDSSNYFLFVEEELIYYIPNAITVDDNSINNVFKPVFSSGLDIYDYHLIIFNRWGEIVFESFNSEVGWNGKYKDSRVMDGVYIWNIDFGLSANDERQRITGHVTVIK